MSDIVIKSGTVLKNVQYGFYFDQTRCHGCQTCVVACKDWNGVNPGPASWREVSDVEVGEYPTAENGYKTLEVFQSSYSCMHCNNPACIEACGYGAIYKRSSDGIVIIDRDKCKGLGTCITACPYKAIKLANDEQEIPVLPKSTATRGHTAQKCGACLDRIYDENKRTLNDTRSPATLEAIRNNINESIPEMREPKPACVASCRMRAMDFGNIEELKIKYPDAVTIADGVRHGNGKFSFPPDNVRGDGRPLRARTGPNLLVKLRK